MITLAWDATNQRGDISQTTLNQIAQVDDLQTSVIISLFTDARADAEDIIPKGDSRRGWWGDTIAATPGDRIGSKLWQVTRTGTNDRALRVIEEVALEALDWMLDDGVAESIEATASRLRNDAVLLTIDIERPAGDTFRWSTQWVGVI